MLKLHSLDYMLISPETSLHWIKYVIHFFLKLSKENIDLALLRFKNVKSLTEHFLFQRTPDSC